MRLGLLAGENVRSFSPIFFQRVYGLFYQLYTPSSANWKQEISQLRWIGFNVTTPYKEAILSYLDEVSPEVAAIQAANTVAVLPDGKWIGYNTDYLAAMEILKEMHQKPPAWESLVLLGTGGAARAVAYAHASLFPSLPVVFISRAPRRVKFSLPFNYTLISYEEAHSYTFSQYTLLVQGTPVGMFPRFAEVPPFPLHRITSHWKVWELIYNPNPTRFARLAYQKGATVETGLHLFRRQAEHSLRIWSEAWNQAYKPILRKKNLNSEDKMYISSGEESSSY